MKRDMTGGAVVMATMAALADVGCPVRVIGLVAAAENAISGSATRPGDVLRHYGGRTSEVTNTDAEGRLVLADAMAYAVDKLDPDVLVDVATLTGGDQGGARPAGRRAVRQQRRARRRAAGRRRDRGRAAVAVPARRRTTRTTSPRRSPTPTTARRDRRRSPPRCSSSTSPATSRGPTSTSRRSATRRRRATSGRPGPTGFGARALLDWLGSDRPPGRDPLMLGLTVRWSLADAPDGVEEELAAYVADTSHARFTGMPGLRFKTWRVRPGEWFEGCYVFATDAARAEFQAHVHRGRRGVAGLADHRQRAGPDRGVRHRRRRRGLGRLHRRPQLR